MSEEYLSLEEKISKNISKKIGEKLGLSELEIAKMEYGFSILFVDAFKLLFIYAAAFLLQIGLEVFITHLSFIVIRKNTKSYHASNSTICTILSLILLVFLPFLATFFAVTITRTTFALLTLALCGILGLKKAAITQELKNRKTRLIGISLLLTIIGVVQPSNHIRTLIFLGMAIATFLTFINKRRIENA